MTSMETASAESQRLSGPTIDMCSWLHPWDRRALEEFREGGVSCVGVTCTTWEGSRETIRKISELYDLVRDNSDIAMLVREPGDVLLAADSNRLGIMLHFQNTSAFDDDIRLVQVFKALGVHVVQLTYNTQNSIGSGCYERVDSGLSEFGRSLVRELNECHVLVDVSHCGDQTTLDAIDASSAPVVVTHANVKRLAPKTRNKTDEICRAIASNGGVIGVATYSSLLPRGAETTLAEFCDLVDGTVELVGVEHVGLGTDYYRGMPPEMVLGWCTGRWSRSVPAHMDLVDQGWNGEIAPFPSWFTSPRDTPNVSRALAGRGYSTSDVSAIMGGNWLRVLGEVLAS
jgi:membrane dipeptidase